MRLSVIILAYNAARHITACVESLANDAGLRAGRDEIVIVENGSRDGSAARVRDLELAHPGLVRGIYLRRNTGTTVSRNRAIAVSRGHYLLVLDADVTVPAGTIDRLMALVATDPSCGIAVPRLIHADGRPQLSVDVFPTLRHKLARFLGLRRMERGLSDTPAMAHPTPVDYAISAFWLLRRDVIAHVGLLDERIFYAPEDVDYCIRVWQAGLRVLHVADVHAVHDARELSRGAMLSRFTLLHLLGLAYLFIKHRYLLGLRRLYARLGRPAAGDGWPAACTPDARTS